MHVRTASKKSLLVSLGIAVGWLSLTGAAAAQAIYYRSVPIGERAIGLGGAFTGVASDPSATYYNPAGMVRGGRFELLGSFSSIGFTRVNVDNAFVAPNAGTSFSTRNTTALPRFIGTVVRFGRQKFGDDHQFALGYSSLEVARDNLSSSFSSIDEAQTIDLRIDENYNQRWYGVSFAAEVSKKASVGFSVFLSDQTYNYNESIGLAAGGTFDEQTGIRTGGASVTASTGLGVNSFHFVIRLGWLYEFSEKIQLGLMFQAPGIPLKQTGSVVRRTTTNIPPNEPTFFLVDDDDVGANQPIPFELRAGVGWQATTQTLVTLDAAIAGPVRSGSVLDAPSQVAAANRELGAYYSGSTERRWTPNVAVGIEHQFRALVIAAGFFTNVSAALNVPETSQEFVNDQVNLWGLSASIGVNTNGYRFTLGGTAQFGRGDALAVTLNQNGVASRYQRTTANQSTLLLFIGGAVSVASKTAKQLQKKLKAKKSEAQEDESTEGIPSDPDASANADAVPAPNPKPPDAADVPPESTDATATDAR